jgi:hypothetical protein
LNPAPIRPAPMRIVVDAGGFYTLVQ